ncbi:MAG: hypothetical protein QM674_02155 [Burkholderiaceae bacterium]
MDSRYGHEPLIAVCDDDATAASSLRALLADGLGADRLSLIGRPHFAAGQAGGIYTIGGRLKLSGRLAPPWQEAWTQLTSPAVFLLPPVGLVVAAGPFTLSIAAGLRGADDAVGDSPMALALALWSIGVSRDQAIDYENALAEDRLLIVVQDSPAAVERARNSLARVRPVARQAAPPACSRPG